MEDIPTYDQSGKSVNGPYSVPLRACPVLRSRAEKRRVNKVRQTNDWS